MPRVIIRYPNQSGALVLVNAHPAADNADPDHPARLYDAGCSGCLDEYRDYPSSILPPVRTWANEHATACRALPQTTSPEGESRRASTTTTPPRP
jgi:hypothetical protein